MIELLPQAKSSHEQVRFEDPSKHGGERCSGCIHFIRTSWDSWDWHGRCETVASPIPDNGWCIRYEDRT